MEHVLILQNDTHRKTATAAQVYKLQCSPLIMTCAPSVTWQIWPVNEFTLASLTTIGKLWQTTSNHPHSMSFSALKGWLPAVAFVPMPPSLQLWQLLALQTAWARELTVSKLFPNCFHRDLLGAVLSTVGEKTLKLFGDVRKALPRSWLQPEATEAMNCCCSFFRSCCNWSARSSWQTTGRNRSE